MPAAGTSSDGWLAHLALATSALTLGDEARATRLCEALLRVRCDPYVYAMLGAAYRLRGDLGRADRALRAAIEEAAAAGDTSDFGYVTQRGRVLLELGRHDECAELCGYDVPAGGVQDGDHSDVMLRILLLVDLEAARGNADQARAYLVQAEAIRLSWPLASCGALVATLLADRQVSLRRAKREKTL
jgi:ATP/maltotriose-dependent transcriptional regulator MalT